MREYEVMLILPAEADEKVVSTAADRITKVVSTKGGEVSNIDRWGRRRFAFEIDHANEGYYVVVSFTAEPSSQTELDRVLNLADEVIRHKVIALPAKGRHAKRAEARGGRPRSIDPDPDPEASPAPA
ncbi:MAG: 30S ribosomal protein S6 [Actinobacteria bacterium]|nr:30S ribosomal protein S6 [Actinomycetota bacterium]MDQ3210998.1 30S ribosomal protein S6 [Actinomycetota bacterium]